MTTKLEEERVRDVTAAILFPWAGRALELLHIMRDDLMYEVAKSEIEGVPSGTGPTPRAARASRMIASIDDVLKQASQ